MSCQTLAWSCRYGEPDPGEMFTALKLTPNTTLVRFCSSVQTRVMTGWI
jgi:hypothetical protein